MLYNDTLFPTQASDQWDKQWHGKVARSEVLTSVRSEENKCLKLERKGLPQFKLKFHSSYKKSDLYLPFYNFFNITKHGIPVFPVTDTLQ